MSTSPLLQQYFTIKQQYPDAILFFQVGDFYELFFEDAQKAAAFLGITLTKRGTHNDEPVPLCGVPVHALDHYLVKLVKGGFRVVICDQLEAARPGKIVERGVKQVLTPGTLTDIKLLQEKSASYCAALCATEQSYGLVFVELLTGHIFMTVVARDQNAGNNVAGETLLEAELRRFAPDEIIIGTNKQSATLETYVKKLGYVTTLFDAYVSLLDTPVISTEKCRALEVGGSREFDAWLVDCTTTAHDMINASGALTSALRLLYSYLKKNQPQALDFCRTLFFYSPEDFLMLDAVTQHNLELVQNAHDGSSAHTLFAVLDQAVTSMGSRMLKKWLLRPLLKREAIEQRLDVVELFATHVMLCDEMSSLLKGIGDIERVVGRIVLQRAQVHDYRALLRALELTPSIAHMLQTYSNLFLMERMVQGLGNFTAVVTLLQAALNDDAEKEWLIRQGYNQELDRLRSLMQQGSQALADLERQEQLRTGIQSLKIKHNHMHGYAFEITKANFGAVPPDFVRVQSLVGRDRFTTQALKDLEYDIVRAERDGNALEQELYRQMCEQVAAYAVPLKKMTQAVAQCDALLGLASVAYEQGYVRPQFHADSACRDICIQEGKHPVVAHVLKHSFIPNDTQLTDAERTWIITGPNMGGKSTYLRQVALVCVMAQVGSFVPARHAQLPLLDRIFTRIGAADNVAQGKSTFLVEMEETALICNQATGKSLVILDEVGRGTSTYDGLAIAQAVVEYLHEKIGARALFATHYHELTALADAHPGMAMYHAASKKTERGIILLHKINRGVADGSFGLEVAKGAQLPPEIVTRAESILRYLKQKEEELSLCAASHNFAQIQNQMQFYAGRIATLEQEIKKSQTREQRLAQIDYENLSPKQAFDILWELKQ